MYDDKICGINDKKKMNEVLYILIFEWGWI